MRNRWQTPLTRRTLSGRPITYHFPETAAHSLAMPIRRFRDVVYPFDRYGSRLLLGELRLCPQSVDSSRCAWRAAFEECQNVAKCAQRRPPAWSLAMSAFRKR
jgi:hypothetical protein